MIDPITTKGKDGNVNGWLLPIWNATVRPHLRPEQVYMTVVDPGCVKGPHQHNVRAGRFLCLKGNVMVVKREDDMYVIETSGEDGYALVEVAPGTPCALYNVGTEPAYVLNMPSPAWEPNNQDDWPVHDWTYQP